MRISDWSSGVCSSDLPPVVAAAGAEVGSEYNHAVRPVHLPAVTRSAWTGLQNGGDPTSPGPAAPPTNSRGPDQEETSMQSRWTTTLAAAAVLAAAVPLVAQAAELPEITIKVVGNSSNLRSEEQPSELQSLMRNSYAVFCLKKK